MKSNASLSYQPLLFGSCPIASAVEDMALAGIEERGAVFTRREVVEFILDLSGYRPDRPLYERRLLEPSFGGGDFLLPAAERLLSSYRGAGGTAPAIDLAGAIRGVELHGASFAATSRALEGLLLREGLSASEATALRTCWLIQGDYLLTEFAEGFDFVVGNPPYVRQELVPDVLMAEYRRRYKTIYDRADIYVPFIERSLRLLKPKGVLGFICADRWMKNRYGRPLRELVAQGYHLQAFIDMVDTPAFTSDVIAYPGIFIIAKEPSGATRVARQPQISGEALGNLATALTTGNGSATFQTATIVGNGGEPWIVDALSNINLVRRLEADFPALEEAGCRVGIGVATGADKSFIGPFADLDVEDDRKLPLVMTRDILDGTVQWRGFGVVNPFAAAGGLVALEEYPRLRRYLEARRSEIAARHVAQKAPANWYRTIDRIYPEIAAKPKLLIPDIKGEAHIVYDKGEFYPHHNLYFITSEAWDLRALQAVLLSEIARLFISTYSTKMRGGYLRFQAQYLRRIRIPRWEHVSSQLRTELIAAGTSRDRARCSAAVAELYRLDEDERAAVSLTETV